MCHACLSLVPIAAIDTVGAGVETSAEVLTAIDVHLAEVIERSHRTRVEIALLLENGSVTEVPASLEQPPCG
ncbi:MULTISPECIES: hypothetical protein [unclassified Rhodococcus (in: high G+C Gram-positive bacteria)]|uniref:hypothetical protein n=1 Tax=unclassified Rhodococcus (in: high G+C Gram-positive bacteria) TaxID=192944 RepID=UPI001179E396|nr:hypothetical protein [Rhodococcus sp. 1163]